MESRSTGVQGEGIGEHFIVRNDIAVQQHFWVLERRKRGRGGEDGGGGSKQLQNLNLQPSCFTIDNL